MYDEDKNRALMYVSVIMMFLSAVAALEKKSILGIDPRVIFGIGIILFVHEILNY